jgi:hypothetical protein
MNGISFMSFVAHFKTNPETPQLQDPTCAIPFCVPEQFPDSETEIAFQNAHRSALIKKALESYTSKRVYLYVMDTLENLTYLAKAINKNKIEVARGLSFDTLEEMAHAKYYQQSLESGKTLSRYLQDITTKLNVPNLPIIHCDTFLKHPEFKDLYSKYKNYCTKEENERHHFRVAVFEDAKAALKRLHGVDTNAIDLQDPLHATVVLYIIQEATILDLWAIANTRDCDWKNPNFIPHTEFNATMKYLFPLFPRKQKPTYPVTVTYKSLEATSEFAAEPSTARPTKSFIRSISPLPSPPKSSSFEPVYEQGFTDIRKDLITLTSNINQFKEIIPKAYKTQFLTEFQSLCKVCGLKLNFSVNDVNSALKDPTTPPKNLAARVIKTTSENIGKLRTAVSDSFLDDDDARAFFMDRHKSTFASSIRECIENLIGNDLVNAGITFSVTNSTANTPSPHHSDDEYDRASPVAINGESSGRISPLKQKGSR